MIDPDIKKLIENEVAKQLAEEKKKFYIFGKKSRLNVGEKCVLQNTLFNTMSGTIHIGDYSFFGHNCMALTGSHDINQRNLGRQKAVPKLGNDIRIGKGVWIGSGTIIIGPCEIGDNSVIAAGSLLLPGQYQENSMFAGSPATFKKEV